MKEGRRFGIAVIVASQGMGDSHADVPSSADTKVDFRTHCPESREIAEFIRVRRWQELPAHIEQLPVGSAYVQTPEVLLGTVAQVYPLE